jgi:hypothetical protein
LLSFGILFSVPQLDFENSQSAIMNERASQGMLICFLDVYLYCSFFFLGESIIREAVPIYNRISFEKRHNYLRFKLLLLQRCTQEKYGEGLDRMRD